MFAHKVIEDIYKLKKRLDDGTICSHYNNVILNAYNNMQIIKSSQKFHMGDIDDLFNIFKRDIGTKLFENNEYLKLPYQKIWFDFTFNRAKAEQDSSGVPVYTDSKHAGLVYSISQNIWIINTFRFAKEIDFWVPNEFVCAAFIGEYDINTIKLAFEYFNIDTNKELKAIKNIIDSNAHFFPFPLLNEDLYHKDLSMEVEDIAGFLSEIQCSIKLLNCKNIQKEIISAPKKLNKIRNKNKKQEIFDYHVLNVVVPSNKKHEYQSKTTPLSHNRVHLCRGHFKEYTKEHPLFGKHVGLYWWQPTVRGNNKDGIVMKDYKAQI